jgi:hypothetical protein
MLSKFLTKSKFGLLSAIVLVGGACSLSAGPIFSCQDPIVSGCNGNTYAIWVVSQTATTYNLEVDIQVTNNYLVANGGPGSLTDSINGVAIDPSGGFTAFSLLSHPSDGTWTAQAGGLSANGCDGSGGGFCAISTGNGSALFTGSTPRLLSWEFLVTGAPPVSGDTAHLKYHYVDNTGAKVGDLGSFDAGIQCIGGSCGGGGGGQAVPEPVSFLLAGSGLIGIYFVRRRQAKSR